MLRLNRWFIGVIGVPVAVALLGLLPSFIDGSGTSSAASKKSVNVISGNENSGITQFGNNNQIENPIVNHGDITIIFGQEATKAGSKAQQDALMGLSSVLEELQRAGELSISREGAEALARNAIQMMANQPLARGVLNERQFTIDPGQSYSIGGTRNRVTFLGFGCNSHKFARIMLNGEEQNCLLPGAGVPFAQDGERFELVFDGFAGNTISDPGKGMFSIYPAD